MVNQNPTRLRSPRTATISSAQSKRDRASAAAVFIACTVHIVSRSGCIGAVQRTSLAVKLAGSKPGSHRLSLG